MESHCEWQGCSHSTDEATCNPSHMWLIIGCPPLSILSRELPLCGTHMNRFCCKQFICSAFPDDDRLKHHIRSFLEAVSQTAVWLGDVVLCIHVCISAFCADKHLTICVQVQVVVLLYSDLVRNHYSPVQHCGRDAYWDDNYCDYVICNVFQHAGGMVGHMRHRSSEELKGPARLIGHGQVVGKARCLPTGQHICECLLLGQ